MKKIILPAMVLLIVSIAVNAQSSKSPKWVPDKGFWVVESNIHNSANCIVYFYNNEKQLVYRENIEGKELKVKKRKIKMKLKKVLEQTIAKYEQLHKASENEMLVAKSFN